MEVPAGARTGHPSPLRIAGGGATAAVGGTWPGSGRRTGYGGDAGRGRGSGGRRRGGGGGGGGAFVFPWAAAAPAGAATLTVASASTAVVLRGWHLRRGGGWVGDGTLLPAGRLPGVPAAAAAAATAAAAAAAATISASLSLPPPSPFPSPPSPFPPPPSATPPGMMPPPGAATAAALAATTVTSQETPPALLPAVAVPPLPAEATGGRATLEGLLDHLQLHSTANRRDPATLLNAWNNLLDSLQAPGGLAGDADADSDADAVATAPPAGGGPPEMVVVVGAMANAGLAAAAAEVARERRGVTVRAAPDGELLGTTVRRLADARRAVLAAAATAADDTALAGIVTVVSADLRALQLAAAQTVELLMPVARRFTRLTAADVAASHGGVCGPALADFFALTGHRRLGVKGLPHIGAVRATALLAEATNVETLVSRVRAGERLPGMSAALQAKVEKAAEAAREAAREATVPLDGFPPPAGTPAKTAVQKISPTPPPPAAAAVADVVPLVDECEDRAMHNLPRRPEIPTAAVVAAVAASNRAVVSRVDGDNGVASGLADMVSGQVAPPAEVPATDAARNAFADAGGLTGSAHVATGVTGGVSDGPPPAHREDIYIFDALNLLYRAYYAINSLSSGSGGGAGLGVGGEAVGGDASPDGFAVHLFITMLMTILEEHAGSARAVIVFDATHHKEAGVKDFRRELDADYKAHRQLMPRSLIAALPYAKRLVHALGLPLVEVPGFEADDVVAALADLARSHGARTVIVSMDKDFQQLLDDGWVQLLRPNRSKRGGGYTYIDAADFSADHAGLVPAQFVDVLALMGDKADGVKGVPGIGKVTAPRLIAEYGSVEALITAAESMVGAAAGASTGTPKKQSARAPKRALTPRLANAIAATADRIRLNRRLVEIERNVALDGLEWPQLARARVNLDAVRAVLLSLGLLHRFSARYKKLADGLAAAPTPAPAGTSAAATAAAEPRPVEFAEVAYLSRRSAEDVHGLTGQVDEPKETSVAEAAAEQATANDAAHTERVAAVADPGGAAGAVATPSAAVPSPAPVLGDASLGYVEMSNDIELMPYLTLHVQKAIGLSLTYAPGPPVDGRPGTLVGMAVSVGDGQSVYVPLAEPLSASGPASSLAPGGVLATLLADRSVGKVGWFLGDAHKALAALGVPLRGRLFDVRLGYGILHAGVGALDADILNETLGLDADVAGECLAGWPAASPGVLALPTAAAAAHAQADFGLRTGVALAGMLEAAGLSRVAADVEMPLLQPLADMEATGIAVDAAALTALRADVDDELAVIAASIGRVCETYSPEAAAAAAAGVKVGSPAQLGALLTVLDARLSRTTASSAAISVSAKVLSQLSRATPREELAAAAIADGFAPLDDGPLPVSPSADGGTVKTRRLAPKARRVAWEKAPSAAAVEVAGLATTYRSVSRLRSSYTDSLMALINPTTGRIHTTYVQIGSATGRVTTVRPNLQSLPTRSPLGRRVRAAVVAPPGTSLLAADYAQIELRILAALSGDAALIAALETGEDVHRSLAAAIYTIPAAEVTSEQRARAKLVSYGVPYGVSAAQLGAQLGLPLTRARALVNAFHDRFPGVRAYTSELVARARAAGYTETLLGRRRPLPALASTHGAERAAAERAAVNAPIQGTQADLVKVALSRVARRLAAVGAASRLVLVVHDELLVEVAAGEEALVEEVVRQEMETAVVLPNGVAIRVDIARGSSWATAAPH
ncbi:hypothetical protein MMPV_007700 [Pyropia vietnamensis]